MLKKAMAGGPAVNAPGENKPEKRNREHDTSGKNKKKFSNKRRLVGLILLLLLSLLLLVGFLLAFILTLQGEPDPNVDVGYTSQISADVSATYQIGSQSPVEVGGVTFDPSNNAYTSQSISFGDIKLTKSNPNVTFTYVFKNKDDVDGLIILQDKAAKHNITYSFEITIDGVKMEEFSLEQGIVVKSGKTCVISQKIEVVDDGQEAYYRSDESGWFVWIIQEHINSEAENV